MRLIDLEELKKNLDDAAYVDPYEIPGFLEHCEECQVIDAIPVGFIKSYALRSGKPLLPFMDLIDEWRRTNGQQ